MTIKYVLPVLFLSVSVLGCSKKEEKETPTDPAPIAETTPKVVGEPAVPSEPEPVKEAEVALPTAVDFEGEAIEKITDETLEKDLKAIEEELGN
tara:strand:+ start:77826 stop:78107 length:282 start_codon:yes stop_codon:yes gene_type:complete